MGIDSTSYLKNKAPETREVIALYPEWRDGNGGLLPNNLSLQFFDAMIDEVSQSLCVDRSKIYIIGHSMGSQFTHKVACRRGNLIRGLVSVGGSGYGTECRGPAASMVMHKPNDHLASFASGQNAYNKRVVVNQVGTAGSRSEKF